MYKRVYKMMLQVLVAICIIGAVTAVYAAEEKAGGAPVAFLESTSFDFGTVFEGADIVHEFSVKNTGDADLKIISVKSG